MQSPGHQLAKELGKEPEIEDLIREWKALIASMEAGDLRQGYIHGRKPGYLAFFVSEKDNRIQECMLLPDHWKSAAL